MDLHGLVRQTIAAVNSETQVSLYQSIGAITSLDGSQAPQYSATTAGAQVQALSTKDLQHMNSLNITGIMRKIYLEGPQWSSVVRADLRGGDIFVFGGYTWLVSSVIESWPDWSAVVVTQQAKTFVPPIVEMTVPTPINLDTHTPGPNTIDSELEIDVSNLGGPVTLIPTFVSGPGDDLTITADPLDLSGLGVYQLLVHTHYVSTDYSRKLYTYDLSITVEDLLRGPVTAHSTLTYKNGGL